MEHPLNSNTLAGTVGGTLMVICFKVSLEEIFNTTILAAVGAIVSFSVSLSLKYLIKRFNRRK